MKNNAYIENMRVSSNQTYIVYGDVRGLVSAHRTQSSAERSAAKDRDGCRGCGGGAYSDVSVYEWTDGGWEVCEGEYDEYE